MRLIDADALKEKILAERDAIPKTYVERYGFGVEVPNQHGNSMRGGIRKALRCLEQARTIDPSTLRPKWISVEDRLPERGQEVIVYRNDCVYSMRFWDEKHPLWQSTSHWMPLPAAPED